MTMNRCRTSPAIRHWDILARHWRRRSWAHKRRNGLLLMMRNIASLCALHVGWMRDVLLVLVVTLATIMSVATIMLRRLLLLLLGIRCRMIWLSGISSLLLLWWWLLWSCLYMKIMSIYILSQYHFHHITYGGCVSVSSRQTAKFDGKVHIGTFFSLPWFSDHLGTFILIDGTKLNWSYRSNCCQETPLDWSIASPCLHTWICWWSLWKLYRCASSTFTGWWRWCRSVLGRTSSIIG